MDLDLDLDDLGGFGDAVESLVNAVFAFLTELFNALADILGGITLTFS
jgi:hypothetical protein